ncbi:hypothetical protein [Ketogulonicigenium vulgare]|uniref:hypothetical protein n=1 Tax=Ketogulonicigenium vulgare TaxID=92945 RepID=UPI00235A0546|nr:hypothetical protein [Ketogulonicigenium vulgare]
MLDGEVQESVYMVWGFTVPTGNTGRRKWPDPVGAMQAIARDGAIITLMQNGEIRLPLFQFDRANDKVFDAVREILRIRPARISNLGLTYWLTRAHVDFGCAPAERFGTDDAIILNAFRRYIEPVCHG